MLSANIQRESLADNSMCEWLDLHIGTDWATYQGWIIGIVGLGLTIYGLIRQVPKIKQRIDNKKLGYLHSRGGIHPF